ncbi:glycosyltransferase family A protein [Alteromonas sp. C1M14]|uniref:glycosyltransferase family 2 protein n=1 Tax=Alteromonas sp. C1M14 TaxID=2841567 RepID=UPI001C09C8C2|nr:glycosyltransferase family A protein [Alteromonas sp. C1M14]MBU2979213.1 glycosyltransferase family 2 protein [Alteromonas sp. C1M14]
MSIQQKVSVIVPFYNGGKTLGKTLAALFAQTYTEIEVIVVNDGSPEPIEAHVQAFVNEPRLHVITQKNGGVAGARNTGIKAASGAFIAFCDQDDIWHPDKLAQQMPHFDDPAIGLVYTGTEAVNTQGHSQKILPTHEGQCFAALSEKNFITCCTVVLRKSLIEQIGYFNADRQLQGVDDRFVWMRVSRLCEFAVVNKPLATYVIHGDNYSLDNQKMLDADVYCMQTLAALPDMSEEEIRLLERGLQKVYLHYANNFLYRNQTSSAGRCYRAAWQTDKQRLDWLLIGALISCTPPALLVRLKRLRKAIIS